MTTLAVEMTASRLLGSVFGTSNLVWANVIGLMLLYLTAGYFIGGRWADRSPFPATFYKILVWGAFLSSVIPLISRPVLSTAASAVAGAEAALALGSFFSVLVLFAIPVTLLGTVSPFAIRLAVNDIASSGRTAGRIYAISTVGSLIGTFLPVVLLIPEIGTFRTFMLFSGILYAVGWFGLLGAAGKRALVYLWMPLLIFVLSLLVLTGPLRPAQPGQTLLYEVESAYNYIQVQEDEASNRYLYLNEGQGIHSQWHKDIYGYGRTWDYFLSAPYFNAPVFSPDRVDSLLIIGLAAGTIARQHAHVYGHIPMTGIEIDGEIVEVAKRFFEMDSAHLPSLQVIVEDGRYALSQLQRHYRVIAVDAYRPPYIPWHLTTVEFFAELRALLEPDGVVAINVGRTSTDRRLVDALTQTMLEVFPSVHAMDVPFSFNTILIATALPTTPDHLVANLEGLPDNVPPLLRDTLTNAAHALVPSGTSDIIFTDDRAPVETLVDSLVINFLLSGGVEQLREGS